MTTIFLVGSLSDVDFRHLIMEELSKTYTITLISSDIFVKIGKGYELLVIETEYLPEICKENCIIILKQSTVLPKIDILDSTTIIADSQMKQLHSNLNNRQNVIMCGTNKMDTFTYSSLINEQIMVTLTRNILAHSGKIIEPLDLPIQMPQNVQCIYSILAFTALRLTLDDFNSDIGKIY